MVNIYTLKAEIDLQIALLVSVKFEFFFLNVDYANWTYFDKKIISDSSVMND